MRLHFVPFKWKEYSNKTWETWVGGRATELALVTWTGFPPWGGALRDKRWLMETEVPSLMVLSPYASPRMCIKTLQHKFLGDLNLRLLWHVLLVLFIDLGTAFLVWHFSSISCVIDGNVCLREEFSFLWIIVEITTCFPHLQQGFFPLLLHFYTFVGILFVWTCNAFLGRNESRSWMTHISYLAALKSVPHSLSSPGLPWAPSGLGWRCLFGNVLLFLPWHLMNPDFECLPGLIAFFKAHLPQGIGRFI